MKNFIKFLGIAVIVAVIGFSMVACPEPEEESGPTSYGDKLEFSNEQVYVSDIEYEGDEKSAKVIYNYKPYTGADVTFDSVCGATPKITGGKFSFSVGVPAAQYLSSDEWSALEDIFTDVKVSDATVKSASISFEKESSSIYLNRANDVSNVIATAAGAGENAPPVYTGSVTTESVLFVYVDKAVTITGKGKTTTETEEGRTSTYKYNDINLSLAKGWNTLCSKTELSVSATSMSYTITQSVSNPSSVKWVLNDYSND